MPNQINSNELPEDDEEGNLLPVDPFEAFTQWASPEDDEDFKDLAESGELVVIVRKGT